MTIISQSANKQLKIIVNLRISMGIKLLDPEYLVLFNNLFQITIIYIVLLHL